MTLTLTLALAATLMAVVFFDLRQMRIPNLLSLIVIGLFVVSAFSLSLEEIGLRLAVAATVFVIGFFAFMVHAMGGGDVKILAALALFVPLSHAAEIMLIFSACLVVGTICVVLFRRVSTTTQSNWAFLETGKMPMGLSIGSAGLIALCGPYLS